MIFNSFQMLNFFQYVRSRTNHASFHNSQLTLGVNIIQDYCPEDEAFIVVLLTGGWCRRRKKDVRGVDINRFSPCYSDHELKKWVASKEPEDQNNEYYIIEIWVFISVSCFSKQYVKGASYIQREETLFVYNTTYLRYRIIAYDAA